MENLEYSCNLDNKHTVQRTLEKMILHMGEKEGKLHEEWRKKHRLPAKSMTLQSINEHRSEIMKAINDDNTIIKSSLK